MRRLLSTLVLLLLPALVYAADADVPGVQKGDHVRGRITAPVSLIVYSDFQCPFCKTYERTLKQVIRRTHGRVNVASRAFPLSFHSQALSAAQAAECAAKQTGNRGFWQMHDALFAEDQLETADYPRLAAEQKLDATAFNTCMADATVKAGITAAKDTAQALGIAGTPTTFIQQRTHRPSWRVEGAVSTEELLKVITPLLNPTKTR